MERVLISTGTSLFITDKFKGGSSSSLTAISECAQFFSAPCHKLVLGGAVYPHCYQFFTSSPARTAMTWDSSTFSFPNKARGQDWMSNAESCPSGAIRKILLLLVNPCVPDAFFPPCSFPLSFCIWVEELNWGIVPGDEASHSCLTHWHPSAHQKQAREYARQTSASVSLFSWWKTM